MASKSRSAGRAGAGWTKYLWGGAALLLALPFIAMRFTAEVNWTAGDFVIMGMLLAAVCGAIELAVRLSSNRAYRLAAAAAVLAGFLIIWANLAVGIVGNEHDDANMLFFAALLLGIIGSVIVRFKAAGMAIVMLVTAAAIGLSLVVAIELATEASEVKRWREVLATMIISSPFLLSAALFRRAARDELTAANPEAL